MPRKTNQDVGITLFPQATWSGGINTSVPSDLIANTEAVDILNFEFNNDDELVTRNGVTVRPQGILTFTKRFTSIHYYENASGDVHVLATNANQLYEITPITITNITGGLTLPDDTFWQWINYAGLAIGVNKATVGDNPVKVSGGPIVAPLGGGPPKGKYIEIWNERVWIVSATDPNQVYCSALGDPEDWTLGGGTAGAEIFDVGKDDGDQITGLCAFRERLFVFKRTKIYVFSATATPVTDLNNVRLDIFARNLGAISAYSIKPVLNDVLFLSDSGVASLVNAEAAGDFRAALVSRNVKEIGQTKNSNIVGGVTYTSQEITAFVIPEADQYWLMIPKELSVRGINETYVFDYRRLQEQLVRWVRFDGRIAGTVIDTIFDNGNRLYFIGGYDPTASNYRVYQYISKPEVYSFNEDGFSYAKSLETKAYNFDLALLRKLFAKFGLSIDVLTAMLQVSTTYFFDQTEVRGGNYNFNLTTDDPGGLWDVALWDVGLWAGAQQNTFRIWRKFKHNTYGRKGLDVTFVITNNQVDQGLGIKNLSIEYGVLNERNVSDV